MSTYCISDIHGRLEAFMEMLNRIDFKYDGSDNLIIMGDMVDWGEHSIMTLEVCKKLDKEYDFVTVLMGNHDYMMLDYIKKMQGKEVEEYFRFTDWGRNGGVRTLRQYLELADGEQDNIKRWLNGLRYFVDDLEVGGRKFYVTHSNPYLNQREGKSVRYRDAYERMVWERVDKEDNPLMDYLKDNESILVHGHTIVSTYGSTDEAGKCKIYTDLNRQKIGIDCGSKRFGEKEYARLSCIRLDDLQEYYIEQGDLK